MKNPIAQWLSPQTTFALFATAGVSLAVEVAPPPSQYGKMAYDTARQEVVLYGLIDTSTYLTQTWVWNGHWVLKNPTASPPGIKVGGLAYDEARQQTVFFGGLLSANYPLVSTNGTWLWDGTNWSAALPSVRPLGRFGVAMACDSLRGQVVLFGGEVRTGYTYSAVNTNDTWVWNGADWALKSPANRPSVRAGSGLAFDAARGQTVLFGGLNNNGGGGDYNDTWVWDGTNWTEKFPATTPPKLGNSGGMAYDQVRREVVLFGGAMSSGLTNGTWVWNGTNWFQKTPLTRPPGRGGHALAFDPSRGKVVLFGGQGPTGSSPLLADTWLWDGTNWSSSDMTLSLAVLPNTILVGSNLTCTVNITNKGPSVASEVALVRELPASVAFVSASASQGSCSHANGVVTCDLGSVSLGTNVVVAILVTPLATGTITNTATVLCGAELNPSNNVARAVTTVVSPPVVNSPLTNRTASAGAEIVMSVSAAGSLPLTYQWFLNGTTPVGHGLSWIGLANLDWSQAGYYTVIVSNPWGSLTNTALLSVSDLRMYAGVRIGGAPGASYQIEVRDSLNTNETWQTLTNLALPYSPFLFIDDDSPNYPQRFYRIMSP